MKTLWVGLVAVGIGIILTGCLKSYYNIGTRPDLTIEIEGIRFTLLGELTYPDQNDPAKRVRVEGHIPADSSSLTWDIGWFFYSTSDRWFDSLIFVIDTTMIIPQSTPDTFVCSIPDTVAAGPGDNGWHCQPLTLGELHAEKMTVRMVVRDIRIDRSRPPRRFVLEFEAERWTQRITILSGK